MSRFTKNINDKQTYCGYEIKECKYQQIYDFKKYDELEDYVDCDLTLAIDKLGKLEDLQEQIGCPLEVVFKALKQNHIFVEEAYCCEAGEVYKLEDKKLCYVNIDLSIQFTAVEEIDDYFKEFANRWCWQFQYNIDHDDYSWDWYLVKLTDYKKTWWLKEDRSE